MKCLLVYCEGPTEESFVKEVLAPYLQNSDIFVKPIGAGGVSRYSKIKKELRLICKNEPKAIITTMLDYYGLPNDVPGVATASGSLYAIVEHIEAAVEKDLGIPNLHFNLDVHEFEGFLFTDTEAFSPIADEKQINALVKVKNAFPSPEHINNSFATAPSRRILGIIPNYVKVRDGTIVAKRIGIDSITSQCQHFGKWVSKIVSIIKQ